jgi:hypothetical protein
VISLAIARKLGGRMIRRVPVTLNGRKVPIKLVAIALKARGCNRDVLAVAVDDAAVSMAGWTREGESVEVILGHDYLENQKAILKYGPPGQEDDVSCSREK